MKKIVFLLFLAINFSFNLLAQKVVLPSNMNEKGQKLRFMTKDEELEFDQRVIEKTATCGGSAVTTIDLVECSEVGTAAYSSDIITGFGLTGAAGATVPTVANAGGCGAYNAYGSWYQFNPEAGVTSMNFLLEGGTVAKGSHNFYAQFFQGASCASLSAIGPCQLFGGANTGVLWGDLLYLGGIDASQNVWLYVWDDGAKAFDLDFQVVGSAPSTNTTCAGASTNSVGCNVGAPPATWTTPYNGGNTTYWFDPPTSMFDATYSVCDGGNWSSMENTIYFSFTASSTTGSIGVTGITCNEGVAGSAQFGVFNNCGCLGTYSPACYRGCAVGSGTLDLAGLTPGQTYIIAVDGFAGDDCTWNFTTTGIILPVELLSISAKDVGYGNKISWASQTERDCDRYVIERSSDGLNYEYLNEVKGNGNSTSSIDYSTFDSSPLVGANYYRLTQYDYNGHSESYMPVIVYNDNQGVTVIPNPVIESAQVRFGAYAETNTICEVYDVTGKLVYQTNLHTSKGENTVSLELTNVKNGFYTLIIKNDKESKTVKFTKE